MALVNVFSIYILFLQTPLPQTPSVFLQTPLPQTPSVQIGQTTMIDVGNGTQIIICTPELGANPQPVIAYETPTIATTPEAPSHPIAALQPPVIPDGDVTQEANDILAQSVKLVGGFSPMNSPMKPLTEVLSTNTSAVRNIFAAEASLSVPTFTNILTNTVNCVPVVNQSHLNVQGITPTIAHTPNIPTDSNVSNETPVILTTPCNQNESVLTVTPTPPNGIPVNETISPLDITLGDISVTSSMMAISPTALMHRPASTDPVTRNSGTKSLRQEPVVIQASDVLKQFSAQILAPVKEPKVVEPNQGSEINLTAKDAEVQTAINSTSDRVESGEVCSPACSESSVHLLASMANVILPEQKTPEKKETHHDHITEKDQGTDTADLECNSVLNSPTAINTSGSSIAGKAPYEIVAAVAQYISTPVKDSDNNNLSPEVNKGTPCTRGTPRTRSQTRLARKFESPKRLLRPKGNLPVTTPSPIKLNVKWRTCSPKKSTNNPRRELLQKQARQEY